jgi:parvulin-like peptidyl-prolyl isomerase
MFFRGGRHGFSLVWGMTSLGRFTLRLAIYGTALAWLAGDLLVFHGPLRRRIDRANPQSGQALAAAKGGGVVARVFNHQITRSQLERALHERLWLEGKTPADLRPDQLRMARYAAVGDLIDHALLRVKAKAHAQQLRVSEEEVNERLRRMLGRFVHKGEMERAMKSQGIPDERHLRERVAARIQQEKYVEMRIAPLAEVTAEEAREWFSQNAAKFAQPETVRARQIFLSTLERPREQAQMTLQAALKELATGSVDFAALAARLSEDPSSKERGGDLGWMSRARLPEDFSGPVFSLPLHEPTLLVTRIGCHLVEVTERRPARERTFEEAEPEVMAALQAVKRERATTEFRDALRRFEAAKIDVYHDMLAY